MRLFHFSLLFTLITGFNSSEEDPDSSRTPYTGTDHNLGSVSQGGSPGATRLPDIFVLGSESVPQGGAHSGSGDKNRLRVVPQEIGHNGQEKAVSVIFDPVHTAATHSLTDSRLSFTEKEHGSSFVSVGTPKQGLSPHTPSAAISVNTLLHTTEIHSGNTHKDFTHTEESRISDLTVMSSAPTASPPYLTTLRSSASVTESQTLELPGFNDISEVSVMSSSYAANEETRTTHNARTNRFSNHTNPDLSTTDESDTLGVSVSDLTVSEFGDMTSVRKDAPSTPSFTAETEPIRTHRLPRSTFTDGNVSNHTPSSLFDDPPSTATESPTASGSHPYIDTSVLTDRHVDAPENITTTDRTRTENSSYTLSYTRDTTSSDSTTGTHVSDTEHTTLERRSDADTQHTQSSGILPTRSYSSSVTWTRRGFTWTPTSYPDEGASSDTPHTITIRANDLTATIHGDHAPYDTTETQPSTEVSTQIQNETAVTAASSPSHHADPGTTTVTQHAASTSREHSETPTSPNIALTPPSRLTSPFAAINTSTIHTSQTSHPVTTTHPPTHLTTRRNTPIVPGPDTTQQAHTDARSHPGTHTPVIAPTSSHTSGTHKDWSQKGRVFITEDQPAIIGAETFQVLLQVVLEENLPPNARLEEVESFLQNVAGYQRQDVTWHSGAVLQSVVTFRTAGAVSWLGRAESLLKEVGLRPLPKRGVFVSGIRVKNITVGGLHSDVCSWLFSCPSNFFCISSEVNVSCRSMCHSEYCKNHGICVHRTRQNPLCQCPVGEDFWFMGQRCDLRMTRQRLAGVCFGVLVSIAALMALLAYVAVLRFKRMLIQAKAEQTQSSYRRFNHFDELSARFWRRSWPGSADSLDNTAFSHSDELLHMRALDRPCCYHDDTLSIASTYPDSVTHLNTVYPHGSQYHWDMSTCSLADGVVDSGKASDLSVCSWPIEPIQWTPFPLLQQLRNTNTVKPARPRSYCEGMELVGLEKSRTA
ncbi:uncharacterized protein Hap1MRO34_020891 [Clarias gariepinus]